ncbi:MAG: antibiotic biosynthesis monooxygenase [Betaproteobacteria bacterium]|jgi:quinol monooxygenase YgiN|nr:antibiotic biosynthesis monooxygenase [Betaproteobacteria bacterium]MBK7742565.1 antibiotic biosynthesis monooxygenase [Betaproteobacteria bacterium]MBK8690587.1 antibiotic biosynthesis monooxygenase [Betaproteobacteria bacterium]MBK9702031.1 antibiotic biosynthesis monooxygenase [Betaproteobacteria bacterium]
MIHVVATVRVKPGRMAEALAIYRPFAREVEAEQGCLQYRPTVDVDLGLPTQRLDPNRITVTERWESIENFRAHLVAPHVVAWREAIRDCLDGITVTVTRDAG